MATGKAAANRRVGIESNEELDRAIEELDRLLDKRARTPGDNRKVDSLGLAIREYEQRNYPEKNLDSKEQLIHLLTIHGLTTHALSEATGVNQSKLEAHLKGDRCFNGADAKKLADYFSLNASTFCSDSRVQRNPSVEIDD
jgi:antitoxin component HigA of HigAB toxin-antitoxin module